MEYRFDNDLIFTGEDQKHNWFYNKYFYGGGNARYYSFQLCLNMINQTQTKKNPNDLVILETGCQRQEDDLGGGMSTSIFGEYISRYGGKLISVDNNEIHLARAENYLGKWPHINASLYLADSISFLQAYKGPCSLLYLDSLDYPIAENEGDVVMQKAAQQHCLKEFQAIEQNLTDNVILLVDDNALNGGGKPKVLKDYLKPTGQWICLFDSQQTVWIKRD